MAINGSFYGKTSNSAIKPKITWEAVADEGGNFSQVTATLTYSRRDGYKTYGQWAGSLTIGTDTKTRSGHYMEITKDSNTLAISHSVRVDHNDNGSKTLTISAAGGISGTTLTQTTVSAEVTLENIPRAAAVAASDGDIGSTVLVTIGKKNENHRYQLSYTFGSKTGYLTENGLQDTPAYTKAACVAFPLPESFYEEIPRAPTGVCSLCCTTFLEDTPIGQPQTASFTVRANPERCGPLLKASVTDSNPQTRLLTGDGSILIRSVSGGLCTMEATARCAAALVEKKIADTGIAQDSLEISPMEQDSLRFWVKDSRGYTVQEVVKIPMVPYFAPVVRLEAARKDPVSGEGILQAKGSFYNGSFGAAENTLQLRWRLNEEPWQTLIPTVEGNGFTCSADISGMDYACSHRITLEVSDALKQVAAQTDIRPGIPLFDWGREDFSFHVPVYIQDVEILKALNQLRETCLPAPAGAAAGQFLRIRSVNEQGGVSATESVDQPLIIPISQSAYDSLGDVDEGALYLIVREDA